MPEARADHPAVQVRTDLTDQLGVTEAQGKSRLKNSDSPKHCIHVL